MASKQRPSEPSFALLDPRQSYPMSLRLEITTVLMKTLTCRRPNPLTCRTVLRMQGQLHATRQESRDVFA